MGAVAFGVQSPRAVFASLMSAVNAAAQGDSAGELAMHKYLVFEGSDIDTRDRTKRVAGLVRLLDISTFRVDDAPMRGVGGRATFEIGPVGADWVFPVQFSEQHTGQWRVSVPSLEHIQMRESSALQALDMQSFDELAAAQR